MATLVPVESNSIRFYMDDLTTTVPCLLGWNYMRSGTSNGTAWWYDDQPLRVGTVQWHNSRAYNLNAYMARAYMAFTIPLDIGYVSYAVLKLVFPTNDPDFKLYVVALPGKPTGVQASWTSVWTTSPIIGSISGVSLATDITFNAIGMSFLSDHAGETVYLGVITQADYNNLYDPISESQKLSEFSIDSLVVDDYIVAMFSGTPTDGPSPLVVTFTDESVATGTTVASWLWDFGDGTTSVSQNPSHTFNDTGFYIISLTATAANGYSDTRRVWKYITVTGNPIGIELDALEVVGNERARGGVVLMPGLTKSPIDHNQLVLNDTLLTVLLKALKTNTLSERARGGVVRMIGMIMATKTGGAFPYGSYPHSFHIGSVDFGVNIETKFIESSFIGRMFNSNDRFRTYDDSWYWIEKFHYDNCLITDSELREGICWREIEDTITLTELDFTTIARLYIADYIIRVGEENRYGKSVENPTLRGEFDREGLNGD